MKLSSISSEKLSLVWDELSFLSPTNSTIYHSESTTFACSCVIHSTNCQCKKVKTYWKAPNITNLMIKDIAQLFELIFLNEYSLDTMF